MMAMPTCHWGDICVDDATQPGLMEVRLKASKTDPFSHGISCLLGKCPKTSAQCLHDGLPTGVEMPDVTLIQVK